MVLPLSADQKPTLNTVFKTKGLTCDQTIELTGAKAKHYPIRPRHIGYKDADTGIHYIFLTEAVVADGDCASHDNVRRVRQRGVKRALFNKPSGLGLHELGCGSKGFPRCGIFAPAWQAISLILINI